MDDVFERASKLSDKIYSIIKNNEPFEALLALEMEITMAIMCIGDTTAER